MSGVAGHGAAIRLDFVDPAGAVSGSFLPTGGARETLEVEGIGAVEISVVDAAAAVVFVHAESVGLRGVELPESIEADCDTLARLEAIRRAAAVRIGLAESVDEAARSLNRPFIALVAPADDTVMLDGEVLSAASVDIVARAVSMGRPHRALPLTVGLCLAAAARVEGTLVHDQARPPDHSDDDLRIAHPAGVLPAAAHVRGTSECWTVERVMAYRTARRLMEGKVLVPSSTLANGQLP